MSIYKQVVLVFLRASLMKAFKTVTQSGFEQFYAKKTC